VAVGQIGAITYGYTNECSMPVAVRSMKLVCGHSIAGIADSNPAEGMDVCILFSLCIV
jgi:hypothetical protein